MSQNLVHATERAKKIAKSSPYAFHRVGVDFIESVAVQIFSPSAIARRMADANMLSFIFAKVIVRAPFVRVYRRAGKSAFQHRRLKVDSSAVGNHFQPDVAGLASDQPEHWRAIRVPGAVAARLVSSSAWRVFRIRVFRPFSPAFWYISSASVTESNSGAVGGKRQEELLAFVAQIQQVWSGESEFLCKMFGGNALGEAPQHLNPDDGRPVRPLQ